MLNVRHLPYIPLKIETLKRSKAWRRAKKNPELGFYMLNLWMASWHSDEAGTLEADDDDLLCDLAGCDPDRWPAIREEALTGWRREGALLVHDFVQELAVEALESTRKNSDAARARAYRRRKRDGADGDDRPDDDVTPRDASRGVTRRHAKEGKEGKEGKEEYADGAAPPHVEVSRETGEGPSFDAFWNAYPRRKQDSGGLTRGSKKKAQTVWGRLTAVTRADAIAGLPGYRKLAPDGSRSVVDAERYLAHERWNDAADAASPPGGEPRESRPVPTPDDPELAEKWRLMRRAFGDAAMASWFCGEDGSPLLRKIGDEFVIETTPGRADAINARFGPALNTIFGGPDWKTKGRGWRVETGGKQAAWTESSGMRS